MRLSVAGKYRELCAAHGRHPVPMLMCTLETSYRSADGEVFFDAEGVSSAADFAVLMELVRALLAEPERYVPPDVAAAGGPGAMRVKLRLPHMANNRYIERLCEAIPTARDPMVFYFPRAANSAAVMEAARVGVCAIESVDASQSAFISLPGARLLRGAARRNVHLKYVFLDSDAVNAATARQLQRATAFNRSVFSLPPAPTVGSQLVASPPPTCQQDWRSDWAATPLVQSRHSPPYPSPWARRPKKGVEVATRDDDATAAAVEESPFWDALTELLDGFRAPLE